MSIPISDIQRSKRKTIALVITPEAQLIVRAPLKTPLAYIEQAVREKARWIQKKFDAIHAAGGPAKPKQFVDGEQFLYLGEPFSLKIVTDKRVTIGQQLYFPEKFLPTAKHHLTKWYIVKAKEVIPLRAQHYQHLTGLHYRTLKITRAEKRWGSCSPNGTINFSWKLMMTPVDVIDYVVVHELAHLVHKNHSEKFWAFVEGIIPEYKLRRKWLRENQHKLTL
jgi:predicted metal-dependent hydrolase